VAIGILEGILLHVIDDEVVYSAGPGTVLLTEKLAARIEIGNQVHVSKRRPRPFSLDAAEPQSTADAEVNCIKGAIRGENFEGGPHSFRRIGRRLRLDAFDEYMTGKPNRIKAIDSYRFRYFRGSIGAAIEHPHLGAARDEILDRCAGPVRQAATIRDDDDDSLARRLASPRIC